MSAIAKPMANFTNAINSGALIPAEDVTDVTAVDIPANPNGPASTAVYSIQFALRNPQGVVSYPRIDFTTALARNTSLTNYKTAYSNPIA